MNKELIPKGQYCYTILDANNHKISVKNCLYHQIRKDKELSNNGYCKYLKIGDWMDNASGLLFDHIKECNINE